MKNLVRISWYTACGVGCGLCLAFGGLTDPEVIKGGLDAFGDFDPRLPVFFVAAFAAYYPLQRLAVGRGRPWFVGRFHLPTKTFLEVRLVVGSALFGVGWAVTGICPGPATANLGSGSLTALWYLLAMVAGLCAGRLRAVDLRTLVRSIGSTVAGGSTAVRRATSPSDGPGAQG